MSIGCVHPIKFAGPAVPCHIMPGIEPASRYTELRRQEAASPKALFAVDAICGPDSPVHDLAELTAVAVAAVEAGARHVLYASQVHLPHGPLTPVLILAQSHLSRPYWAHESLGPLPLLSRGAPRGRPVLDHPLP